MFGSLRKISSTDCEGTLEPHAEQFHELIRNFPIGEKIDYFPEYQSDIRLETIILGYELNELQLFRRDQVLQSSDNAMSFTPDGSGTNLTAGDIRSFAIIVPDTSELEETLDYFSKAAIGKSGQFLRGNSITLLSTISSSGVLSVDTTVLRRAQLKQGPYKDYKTVSLQPQLESLSVKDLRQQSRIELSLPCILIGRDAEADQFDATLIDCAENCLGLRLKQPSQQGNRMAAGEFVRLHIDMPELERTFALGADVQMIRDNGIVVVELQSIIIDDHFKPMALVDKLDLRACLVQFSR